MLIVFRSGTEKSNDKTSIIQHEKEQFLLDNTFLLKKNSLKVKLVYIILMTFRYVLLIFEDFLDNVVIPGLCGWCYLSMFQCSSPKIVFSEDGNVFKTITSIVSVAQGVLASTYLKKITIKSFMSSPKPLLLRLLCKSKQI